MQRKQSIKNLTQPAQRRNPFFICRPLGVARQFRIVKYVHQPCKLDISSDGQQ